MEKILGQIMGILVFCGFFALIWWLLRKMGMESLFPKDPGPQPFSPPLKTSELTHEELQRRLEVLAQSPKPKLRSIGAKCYRMVPPGDTITYLCPTCMQTTHFGRTKHGERAEEASYLRALVKNLSILKARLEEHGFCSHCSKEGESGKIVLILQPDPKVPEHRVEGVSSRDLILLREFLEGQGFHDIHSLRISPTPLKNHTGRIAKLLGLQSP